MNRRHFVVGSMALLGACATSGPVRPAFSSDRLSIVTEGTGPDVMLIHGLGSSREVWSGLVKAVPGYRYHLVQLNGFAGTAPGGNAAGEVIASAIAELARYIELSGLQRPAVIGHSMGGAITLGLAARHDLVSKAIVVDMLPYLGVLFGPPGATPNSIRATADKLRDASLAADPAARQRTVETTIAGMAAPSPLRDRALADALASDRSVTASAYRELIVTDLRPELARIRAPLLVLYVKTPGVPLSVEQFDALYASSYAAVPAVRLKRIDDSLHFIMYDQPQRMANEVRVFLA
jgi:pimeloyl-ACP methyl ester carboxylesterase